MGVTKCYFALGNIINIATRGGDILLTRRKFARVYSSGELACEIFNSFADVSRKGTRELERIIGEFH